MKAAGGGRCEWSPAHATSQFSLLPPVSSGTRPRPGDAHTLLLEPALPEHARHERLGRHVRLGLALLRVRGELPVCLELSRLRFVIERPRFKLHALVAPNAISGLEIT
eukprot:2206931-Rhodomonas_salina.4